MKPVISKISSIPQDHSVVCITGDESVPGLLKLDDKEKDYVLKQLSRGEKSIFVNSYNRCFYIIRIKGIDEAWKIKEEVRRSAYKLRRNIKSNNHEELVIASAGIDDSTVIDFAEGLILSSYSFDKYKTEKGEDPEYNYPSRLLLYGNITDSQVNWLNEVTGAVCMARDLINEPVIHLNALTLASVIKKAGEEAGFSVEVFNKTKIESLKMGGLLAVNRGSVDPPSFSILEWKPEGHVNKDPLVLVGKGIVYDTGGLNLKPGDSMSGMKGDMAGAAVVTGAVYVAAKTGIPLHVIGLVPATDNRPGGNAYTQGDVITMHNKLTVEIANTDAEGRLILADAISYASKYKPELIIDVATLTGSAAMTFGSHAIAAMTNAERKYISMLEESGKEVYERIAELPLWDDYGEAIKSEIADIKNVGGREAGAISAGKFLERFAEYPLIHLDVAGVEILKKDEFYRLKNGTATGLRLLAEFMKRLAKTY
ncbi:MAG TPA: leucyl aminopeptidase family protein [Bacteroidales bacterium]|nr:leucyl aminopeptidase family protein [Bacteroidales bacterium]